MKFMDQVQCRITAAVAEEMQVNTCFSFWDRFQVRSDRGNCSSHEMSKWEREWHEGDTGSVDFDKEGGHAWEELLVGSGVFGYTCRGGSAGPGAHDDQSWRIGRKLTSCCGRRRCMEGDGGTEGKEVREG